MTFGICFKQHFDTRYLVLYNPSPPRMFLSLDLLSEYRISKHQLGCRFDILDSISYYFFKFYFDICNYICLATYHFLALSVLLKYSFFSNTSVPTSS